MNLPNHEWFENPLDRMPLATDGTNRYAPTAKMEELESNPRPEEEVADWFIEQPDESDEIEKGKSMHHKAYEIATSKYNPFSVGGSESISDFQGGSENASSL